MIGRAISFIALSLLYWAIAAALFVLAFLAPCGLAPGAWCEEEGPSWFGAVLGDLGPYGVLLIALIIYLVAVLLVRRPKKVL